MIFVVFTIRGWIHKFNAIMLYMQMQCTLHIRCFESHLQHQISITLGNTYENWSENSSKRIRFRILDTSILRNSIRWQTVHWIIIFIFQLTTIVRRTIERKKCIENRYEWNDNRIFNYNYRINQCFLSFFRWWDRCSWIVISTKYLFSLFALIWCRIREKIVRNICSLKAQVIVIGTHLTRMNIEIMKKMTKIKKTRDFFNDYNNTKFIRPCKGINFNFHLFERYSTPKVTSMNSFVWSIPNIHRRSSF